MPEFNDKWELVACPETDPRWSGKPGFTLRERESGLLMHSRIGPWTEANAIYVAASTPIFESPGRDSPNGDTAVIYDIGMGMAVNALATIEAWGRISERLEKPKSLRIFSFERYPEALGAVLAGSTPFRDALQALMNQGEWRAPFLEWKLIRGDFREAELSELPPADRVYFDFYEPASCPELWSTEIFSKILPKLDSEGLLITYSSSKAVRASMLLAGFFVGSGTPTQMKSATTVASPSPHSPKRLLDQEWLASLERSTKPLPEGWKDLGKHPQFSCRTGKVR